MKQLFLMLCVTIGVTAFAQDKPAEVKPNPNAPKIKFVQESFDFGTVVEGPQATHEFKFKNEGKEPLILSNVKASCGCTVPTTPKEPIAPGAKGKIGVKYATDRVGPFTKTVTVTSNAEGQATKTLTIKGTVLPDETPSTPTTKS